MSPIWGRAGHVELTHPSSGGSWSDPLCQLGWALRQNSTDRGAFAQTTRLRLVADARLDDRAGLALALGVDPHRLSDPELILDAYRKWGETCVEHLHGDFAFAIWDGAEQSMFCARDHFGIVPFFYRQQAGGLTFSSRLADLSVPQDTADQTQLLLFLGGIDDDPAATALRGIRRLPPAHRLRWTPAGMDLARYWDCRPEVVSEREDFAAGFRERLIMAVDDRLGHRPLGAMLSGGLDSSSIVSIAATTLGGHHAELQTFSFAYPRGSPFDERRYADAVISAHGPSPHFIDMAETRPLTGLADIIDGRGDLFFAPGAAKILRLLRSAANIGVASMLDGHGGDEVASHGFGWLTELAKSGRWAGLMRELIGVSRTFGDSPLRLFAGYYLAHGRGGHAMSRLLSRVRGGHAGTPHPIASFLHPDLAYDAALSERLATWRETMAAARSTEGSLHRWSVTWPGVAKGFETLRQLAQHAGLELLFPFYDRRVVTYALAIPEREKLKRGQSRAILRDAMSGILPEVVRRRPTKIDFRAELASGLVLEGRDRLEALVSSDAVVGSIVDLDTVRRLTAQLFAAPQSLHGEDLFALWRIYALSMWLERRTNAVAASEPSA